MAKLSLEERVAAPERQMAELKAAAKTRSKSKDRQRTIGMFAGDEVMKRILDEALRFREKDRGRARRRFAEDRRAKE